MSEEVINDKWEIIWEAKGKITKSPERGRRRGGSLKGKVLQRD